MHECPVLSMRRNASELRMFDACYRVKAIGFGTVRYERVALPHEGGAGDQPARLLEALDALEHVANDELEQVMAANRRQKSDGE